MANFLPRFRANLVCVCVCVCVCVRARARAVKRGKALFKYPSSVLLLKIITNIKLMDYQSERARSIPLRLFPQLYLQRTVG